MDPNANLEEQLQRAECIMLDADGTDVSDPLPHDAVRLAELVVSLSEWIERGGFLPQRWKSVQRPIEVRDGKA